MTVLLTYPAFRDVFSLHPTVMVEDFEDNDPLPDTIENSGGGIIASGIQPGQYIEVTGTISNNGMHRVQAVTDTALIMGDEVQLSPETGLLGAREYFDPGGYAPWPEDRVRWPGAAPPFGFGVSTFTWQTAIWAINDVVAITCNASAADAVMNTPDYHWYLVQRSDTPALQPLVITQEPNDATHSYSGSVNLTLASSWGIPLNDPLPPATRQRVFRYCHLYVKRVSGDAIQWLNLSETFG